jgi:hypothetical protein
VSIRRNLGPALRLFFHQARKSLSAQPKMVAHVPAFPLRCQHCTAAIRLCNVKVTPSPIYIAAAGHLICDHESRILHHPMPSVLG